MNENLQPKTLSFKSWISQAAAELQAAGITSATLDSEIILAHTINKNRTYVHAHQDHMLTDREYEVATARLALRVDRVPLAYIIGHKDFYGRQFAVTTATLVPRPESEIMIEALKEIIGNNLSLLQTKQRLVDVGTGSGILGITAKLEFPELDVTLLDISRHALKTAQTNADALGADVSVLQSDLLANYPFKTQYILANLPYVDVEWERSPETQHEPEIALFASSGGKSLIFKLLIQAKQSLVVGGYLFIEADPEQHKSIIEEALKNNLNLEVQRDYQLVFRRF